jgi:DNA-binding CsgD family transcriptional regulator/PAS domain-containing protein
VDLKGLGMLGPLLDSLYDAGTEPEMWNVFLLQALKMLRADKAAILVHAPGNERTAVSFDMGVTDELRHDAEQLMKFSPWMAEIQKYQEAGWYSGSPEDVLSLETFRKSRFYNELFCKHKMEWAGAALVFGPHGSMPGLALTRPKTEAPFSANDKELLKQLVPHLARVFRVERAIAGLREVNASGQHALDLIGSACITLDGHGRVLSMNRRAEAMISEGATLCMKGRRLMAAMAVQQYALDSCVVPACACGAGASPDPGAGAVVLHSGQGKPLYVSVLPYHSSWSLLEDRPAALVFITTPEEQTFGEHRLWQTMFGLSPAECRIAELMKQGMEVAEISDVVRIKVNTVRYYQKSVYRKTSVRGQEQLMRLLTRLPSSKP